MEPGGVLHIDERGIVGDGVVAITPHPDFRFVYIFISPLLSLILYQDNVHAYFYIVFILFFRIFLLMDPMHGEISRAMRNRGIEICLLPEVKFLTLKH